MFCIILSISADWANIEMNKGLLLLFSLGCYALGNSLICNWALAQVTPDGTTNTTVNPDGSNNFTIENGDRAGGNLFHSFDQFSVPTNGSAVFNNAPEIDNIFSRVTGGNMSNIDGLIQANDANLFLVNPAGILFGNNARLDIGGSFLGTTADSILFEDGEFSATDFDNPPLLTVNAPIGLGFRDNPAPIENSSFAPADFAPAPSFDDNLFGLRVPDGKTFALAGGDITADGGGIVAVGGRIELGAVGGEGIIELNFDNDSLIFNFPEDILRGNVSLTNNAGFLVSGSGGGNLAITAQNINVVESSLTAGIFSGLGTPEAQAGDINLHSTGAIFVDNSFIFNTVSENGVGNGGNTIIEAESLSILNGGQAGVLTFGIGNTGNVIIDASESIQLDSGDSGFLTGIFAQTLEQGEGNVGNTNIETNNLSVINGSQISSSTFGRGNGGKITINASESVSLGNEESNGFLLSNVEFGAVGDSKGVEINTESLTVNNSSQIRSQVIGTGNSGNIDINAQGTVSFDGRDETDTFPSAAFTSVEFGGEGNGGNINIQAESLEITNRAQLLSNVEGTGDAGDINIQVENEVNLVNSAILSEVTEPNELGEGGRGEGGDINITTGSLLLQNGSALLADTENIGNAGDINIEARDSVIVEGEGRSAFANSTNIIPSQITATVDGQTNPDVIGNAGNLTINTQKLSVNIGRISASTFGSGSGGDLTVTASEIEIGGIGSGFPTSIFAKAIDGTGDAGNLTITTDTLVIKDLSSIDVGNFVRPFPGQTPPPLEPGQGAAGSLTINANSIEVNNGIISADNASGEGGELEVNANSLTLENGASIVAETTANTGKGGSINLNVDGTLQMRGNSFISGRATEGATGGNVNIDADFIIAFPNQVEGNGSDIIASAVQGEGGEININAESLFGIEEREAIEDNQRNDIDASSEFSLDGTVSINTPDINPIQGATELPTNVVEPDQTVAQACAASRNASGANSFVVKGKGGIAPLPAAPLNSEMIMIDGELIANPTNTAMNSGYAIPTSQGYITPARGVIKTADGQIILTSVPISGNISRTPNGSINCGKV